LTSKWTKDLKALQTCYGRFLATNPMDMWTLLASPSHVIILIFSLDHIFPRNIILLANLQSHLVLKASYISREVLCQVLAFT